MLLYDLTSTYFEINASNLPEGTKRRHGYSRDKRPDCPQVVIVLVVTPEGLPLPYEVLAGNTADSKTLRLFLASIERQYGKARRVWVIKRIRMRATAACRPRRSWPRCAAAIRRCSLEQHLLDKPWQESARESSSLRGDFDF